MSTMDVIDNNRRAWEIASRKYVDESDAFLAAAKDGTLLEVSENSSHG